MRGLPEKEYLFAIIAVCQKWTTCSSILATIQNSNKSTKVQMQQKSTKS